MHFRLIFKIAYKNLEFTIEIFAAECIFTIQSLLPKEIRIVIVIKHLNIVHVISIVLCIYYYLSKKKSDVPD